MKAMDGGVPLRCSVVNGRLVGKRRVLCVSEILGQGQGFADKSAFVD